MWHQYLGGNDPIEVCSFFFSPGSSLLSFECTHIDAFRCGVVPLFFKNFKMGLFIFKKGKIRKKV